MPVRHVRAAQLSHPRRAAPAQAENRHAAHEEQGQAGGLGHGDGRVEHGEARDVGDVAPAGRVARHHQAGEAVAARELPARVRVGEQHRLVPEGGAELAQRQVHLVAVAAGDGDQLAQHVVLRRRIHDDAGGAQHVPQQRAGVGVGDGGAAGTVGHRLRVRRQRLQRGRRHRPGRPHAALHLQAGGDAAAGAAHRGRRADLQARQVGDVAPARHVARHGEARDPGRAGQRAGGVGDADQHGLVAEAGRDLAGRDHRLVAVAAGGDHVLPQQVVLDRGVALDAARGREQAREGGAGDRVRHGDAGRRVGVELRDLRQGLQLREAVRAGHAHLARHGHAGRGRGRCPARGQAEDQRRRHDEAEREEHDRDVRR